MHFFRVEMVDRGRTVVSLPAVSVLAYAWDLPAKAPTVPCRIAEGDLVEFAVEQALIWRLDWEKAIDAGTLAEWIARGHEGP